MTLKILMNFFDEGDDEQIFEDELKEDFFKQLDLIITEVQYVEPTVQDTKTTERETKKRRE